MNKQEFERPYYIESTQLWSILATYDYTTFLPFDACITKNQHAWRIIQKQDTYEKEIACTMIQDDIKQHITLTMRFSDRAYYQIIMQIQPRKKHTILHITYEFFPVAPFTKLLCVFKKPKNLSIPEAIQRYIHQIEIAIK